MRDSAIVKYRVDARNSLVFVNEAWIAEAEAVPQPDLAAPAVIGQGLWNLITDLPLQHIFDGLFQRLRTRQIPSVTYRFRCDTPTARRLHQLTITPLPDEALEFQTQIVAVDARPHARLLDATVPRSQDLLRMCSWCKRIPVPGRGWLEIEEALDHHPTFDVAPLPALTHGICPTCERRMLKLLAEPTAAGGDVATFGNWSED